MKIGKSLKFICVLFVFVLFLKLFDLSCLVRFFLGVPCPTCGMTRALFSLLRLDFRSYLYYNAFALPVSFCVIAICFEHMHSFLFYLVIVILCLNLIYYLYRLSCLAIP